MSHGVISQSRPRWALTAAPTAAVLLAIALAAAGLLWSRAELVLVALPLAASAAWGWDARPRESAPVTLTPTLGSGSGAFLDYTIAFDLPAGVDAVHLRLATLGARPRDLIVARDAAASIRGRLPVLHSGPQRMLSLDFRLIGTDAAFLSDPSPTEHVERVVAPSFTAITSLPLPTRLIGLTGSHDSSRPGDGGEFRDIHPFTPGDRLRRIDWKATARRAQTPGELYVRRTNATADATVLLVLDSRDDLGENVADWGRSTAGGKGLGSMDLAREAASSVAAGYIRAGDRVGFQDLATQSRVLAPGAGTRQLQRLLRAIELTRPSGGVDYRRRPPLVTAGALLYVFSTFLDDEAGRMAVLWRAAGHRVIGVDVLPAANTHGLIREGAVAHRIVLMERGERMRELAAAGVELMRWQDGELAAQLRLLSTPRRAR